MDNFFLKRSRAIQQLSLLKRVGLRSYGDTRHAPRLAAGGPVAQGGHCGTGAAHTAESIHLSPGGLAFLLATQHPAASLSGGKEGISRHEKCFGSFSWKAVVANCLIFLFIFLPMCCGI